MYFQNEYIDTVQTDFQKAIFFNDCEFSFIKIINRKLNYFKESLSTYRNCPHPNRDCQHLTGNNRRSTCGHYFFQIE